MQADGGGRVRRRPRRIFVTVGTTSFDALVGAVSDPRFLGPMGRPEFGGYGSITVQYGRGEAPPYGEEGDGIEGAMERSAYRFRPTLRPDMEGADLILSHAGAGSIMEGLELCALSLPEKEAGKDRTRRKRLVVVTNASLMGGHQSELAEALGERGHLLVVTDPADLVQEEVLRRIEDFVPVPFRGGDGGRDFAALVDGHFGF